MHYPYAPLISLLEFHTTASEYQQIISPYQDANTHDLKGTLGSDYWTIIPEYLCTRCPLCGMWRTARIDAYSLLGWSTTTELSKRIYMRLGNPPSAIKGCRHLLTYHNFISLHDIAPVELWGFSNKTGEAPLITPWFLPDDIPSYVVIHALPICRLECSQFVPSYTLFILSYYSEDPELVWQRHLKGEAELGADDPEFWHRSLVAPEQGSTSAYLYSLQQWAVQGKLGYLDFTQPDLPLRIGPGTQLPALYRNIPGAHYSYIWRNGEFIANIHQGRRVLKKLIYPF